VTLHTKATIRTRLYNSHRQVERSLYRLWLYQTDDERSDSGVKHQNGRGFNHETVGDGTFLGGRIAHLVNLFLAQGHTEGTIPWGHLLPPGEDRNLAFRVCYVHAGQLAEIVNEAAKMAA
jgi:hypothetical protein